MRLFGWLVVAALLMPGVGFAQAPNVAPVTASQLSGADASGTNVTAPFGPTTQSMAAWANHIPTADAAGNLPVLGPDGATSYVVGHAPAATSAVSTIRLIPGITAGAGGTMLCEQYGAPSTSVGCNIVASNEGPVVFGGGDGPYLQVNAPGAAVTSWLGVTPGYAGQTYPTINVAPLGPNAAISALSFTQGYGFSAGSGSKVFGAGTVVLGTNSQGYGANSLIAGSLAYDFSEPGVRVYQGQYAKTNSSYGTNELWEQTLQAQMTSTSVARMTYDGNTSYTQGKTVPIQTNGHGVFSLDIECTNMSNGYSAVWLVKGSFASVVTALRLPYVTGAGAPAGGDSAMSTASLSVTADTTNLNLNIGITPPSGNSASINCTGTARWTQRIG